MTTNLLSACNPLSAWLALHHLPGLGNIRIHKLFDHYGSARAILEAPRPALQAFGLAGGLIKLLDEFVTAPETSLLGCHVSESLEWAQGSGNRLMCLEDPDYPSLLRWIPDPPPLLYVRGRSELLGCPQIALVGSRHPTPGGLDNARSFAASLGRAGLTVTSGMALGVDAAAHEAALQVGAGTVAVLGTGVDTPYPASNRKLADILAREAVLVSEFALGTVPKAANFPRRNRIISGLSMGTLVIEASIRSGSLITARMALEQGREVYAVPGSIHNPQARGCHRLIKQGAKLVETVDDIMEELPALLAHYQSLPLAGVATERSGTASLFDDPAPPTHVGASRNSDHELVMPETASSAKILAALGYDAVSADLLVARTGLSAQEVSAELMALELMDQVVRSPAGYQRR